MSYRNEHELTPIVQELRRRRRVRLRDWALFMLALAVVAAVSTLRQWHG